MNTMVFDIETVPDVDLGRRLFGLENLDDREAAKARLHAEAHSGNVTLLLPADTSATWEVETFSGNVTNEFGPEAERSSEHGPGKWLKFTTGSGEARITVDSFSGNVRFRKR